MIYDSFRVGLCKIKNRSDFDLHFAPVFPNYTTLDKLSKGRWKTELELPRIWISNDLLYLPAWWIIMDTAIRFAVQCIYNVKQLFCWYFPCWNANAKLSQVN